MWKSDQTTLEHFEKFLRSIFASVCKRIKLKAVDQSLLTFVCSTHFSFTGAIIAIAMENQQLLIELGVISITVGDYVVFKVLLYISYNACFA